MIGRWWTPPPRPSKELAERQRQVTENWTALTDAENECPHGKLPLDPRFSCDCWTEYRARLRAYKGVGPTGNLNDHGAKGRPYMMGEDVIQAARALYAEGLGFRRVAAELHHRTSYASPAVLANKLSEIFRIRGWPVRTREQAVADFNRSPERRGERCEHRHGKTGRRCVFRTKNGTGLCAKHQPENIAATLASLREWEAERNTS